MTRRLPLWPRLKRCVDALRCDASGVAAIEFAFLFPILLVIVAASVDISEALDARGKVTNIASAVAGFVADQNQWKAAEVDDLLKGGAFIMEARHPADLKIRVSILSVATNGAVTVKSSRASMTPAYNAGIPSPVVVPPSIKNPGTDIVLAEVDYTVQPPFAKFWPIFTVADLFTFHHHYLARPRRSSTVTIE
jgi:Flp pilus assembly protein TadG